MTEICRLRASHRYHDADMLAEKLRASVIESAGGQQTTEEAATPAPSAGAADDAKAADAEAPPEKKLTAKERIMALQDALTKVLHTVSEQLKQGAGAIRGSTAHDELERAPSEPRTGRGVCTS